MHDRHLIGPGICIVTAVLISGCGPGSNRSSDVPATPLAKPPAALTRATDDQLRSAHVNEAGVVPILEYHDVLPVENAAKYSRSTENFKKDLLRLYTEGYRPVSLHDYLDNRIAIPRGTSPVVFTFDDARESQFRYLPDGSIDPDCAVGIWQAFLRNHPDFPIKATFYILANRGFGQPQLAAKKLQTLVAMGCEIGNHTITHRALASLSDDEVVKELAGAVTNAKTIDPELQMDTVALPLGSWPHNRKLLATGSYNGTSYTNRAVLKVGAGPAPSPAVATFNPMSLPRMQASDEPFGSTYWLNSLKRHPDRKYVSDGDPMTVSIPASALKRVSPNPPNGARLRTY